MLENSAEGLGSKREHCWSYAVSVFENTYKKLVVQGRVQLEHSNHIVKVNVEATCLHFNPSCILQETTKWAGPFGTMPQEPRHFGKDAKPGCVIQHNFGKVHTDASHQNNRTMSEIYLLNACKLDWEENIFLSYVESIAVRIKILLM